MPRFTSHRDTLPFMIKVDSSDPMAVLVDDGFGVMHAQDLWESYLVFRDICEALTVCPPPLRLIHEAASSRASHSFLHHYRAQEAQKNPKAHWLSM